MTIIGLQYVQHTKSSIPVSSPNEKKINKYSNNRTLLSYSINYKKLIYWNIETFKKTYL